MHQHPAPLPARTPAPRPARSEAGAARTRWRRACAPGLLAGVLAASVAAPPAASAAASRMPDPVAPYRVVEGQRLQVKPPPPWVLPVTGYRLTGRFGASSSLWSTTHTGLDFAAPQGSPVRAIGPGTVTETSYDGAYGNKTVLRLDDGTVLWFCHQSAFVAEVGQRLAAGDLVGYVGSTGNSTGPHLHLEVRPGDGDPVDPETWLPEHGVTP